MTRSLRFVQELCPQCHTSALREKRYPRLVSLGADWVVFPDFPMLVCEYCGYVEPDPRAVDRIRRLVSSGRRRRHPRRPQVHL